MICEMLMAQRLTTRDVAEWVENWISDPAATVTFRAKLMGPAGAAEMKTQPVPFFVSGHLQ